MDEQVNQNVQVESRGTHFENEDRQPGSATKLEPYFIFGLTSSIRGGTNFINDQTMVRPVGRVLVFDPIPATDQQHPVRRHNRRYVRVKSPYRIDVIAVSPDRTILAAAIHGGLHPQPKAAISFYDTNTLNRLVTIGCPTDNNLTQMFEHIAFTEDGEHLVAITGEPDGRLIYYKWRTGGVVASTRADGKWTGAASTITALAPHPNDSSKMAVGGLGVFRMMALYYNEWRQFGFKRAEYWPISGVCWISAQLVLVGTNDGRLMVIEDALLKAEYKVSRELAEIRVSEREETGRKPAIPTINDENEQDRSGHSQSLGVQGLRSFSQGFAFSFMAGEVCVYFKIERRRWLKKNVICTDAPALWREQNSFFNHIKHIDVSSTQQWILCTTSTSEVYYASLAEKTSTEDQTVKNSTFEKLHDGYHYGPVNSLSTCLYKPLFLTAGANDKTCRIWNYETLRMVNMMTFPNYILTATFHPSGLYCIVTFEKSLHMYVILMEGMKSIAAFNIRNCHLVCFSKEGSVFACATGNAVEIYGSTTFEKLWQFQTTRVTASMDFSKRDFQLFICGLDGVSKYCLKTGQKSLEMELNSSNAHCITTSSDGSVFIIAAGDGTLKVFQQKSSTSVGKSVKTDEYDLKTSINLNQSVLNCVTLACDNTLLLAGGQNSTVISVGYPLSTDSEDMKIFKIHSSPVMKLEVAQVTGTVLSLGRDGIVTVWTVNILKRKTRHFREVDEIIIRPARWSNKRTIIEEQQEILARIDKEYHTKLKEIAAHREIEEANIHGKYQGVLDIIGLNNRITLTKNISSLDKILNQKEETTQNFELELRLQRESFENRLKLERDDLEKWLSSWSNVKNGFEKLIDSVEMAGKCVSKRLEYFSAMELTRRVNEAFALRDDILQIIEEQKNRELALLKHSQIEVDELVEKSERHEQTAVELIQLKCQKQKLCEQVEGLENTYYNMQEFLKEIQKTVTALDRRAYQRKAVEGKQKKINDKLEAIRESGCDIVEDLNVSEQFHIRHMVTEECIERLCQVNCLLRERNELETKVQWLEHELSHSTKSLIRLRYVLSFMGLQSYLHHNSLQRTLSVEKDRNRKLRFFKTNFKKEIHNLLCCTDHSALKGRLINLCAQYGDPKVDFLQLLDKLSGGNELWKATEHLEATKLHLERCVNRMKKARKDRSLEEQLRDEMEAEAAKIDGHDNSSSSDSETQGPEFEKVKGGFKEPVKSRCHSYAQGGDFISSEFMKTYVQNTNASSDDAYDTSDGETSDEIESKVKDAPVDSEFLKKERSKIKNQPIAVLRKLFRSCDARETMYSRLLKEKETIVSRLTDVRKRAAFVQKKGEDQESVLPLQQDRAAYTRSYYKIPMNAVIKALNKEVDRLSKKPECHVIVEELFTVRSAGDDESAPNMGHLCSLCKDFGAFSKFFDKKKTYKRSTCGDSNQCKSRS